MLRRVPLLLGLGVASLGALVLAGWWLDLAVMKSVFPGLTSMKANTALGMLLCGSALAMLSRGSVAPPARFWTRVVAAVVIALGALTLGEYLFAWQFGLDHWLFRDTGEQTGTSQPGRMSPAAAFCFLLTGVALLAASQPVSMRLRRAILEALALTMIVVTALALAGYVSAALFGFRWWSYTGMAVHTAAGFMLLGVGFLALDRREGRLKWSLDALTTRGFVAGIVSLLAAAGMAYHFTNQLQDSAAWVSHTQEVLKEIGGVATGVASLGSSQRSYINTGSDRFLEQEEAIKLELGQRIDTLRKLASDNPRQKLRLDQLAPLIAQRIEWGQQTIAARRQGGLSAAEQIIATGKGIELSDGIRRVIKALEDEEYALLDERQKKERTISATTFLLLPLSAFLSITFLSLGLFFLNTGMGERARSEEKAAWLATFPERNPSFIVELDLAAGIIHYLNPYALRLLPDLQSQGLQHPWLAGLPEVATALAERPDEPFRREIAAGGLFHAQTINYIPETKRMRIYGVDITDRKLGELALQKSREEFKELFDSAPIGYHELDAQGRIVRVNQTELKMLGRRAGDLTGQFVWSISADPESARRAVLEKLNGVAPPDSYERTLHRKDGSALTVLVHDQLVKGNDGVVTGIRTVFQDITEKKRAQEELQRSEARLTFALETSHTGAWELSLQDHKATRTLTHDRIFGYKALAPLWTYEMFLEHVLPEERAKVDRSFREATAARGNWNFECRIRRTDGEVRWIWGTGGHEQDSEGKAVRMAGIVQDITERKRVEEALRELLENLERKVAERTAELQSAKETAEAAGRAKSEFLASMSHELRTPLNGIIGFSEFLVDGKPGALNPKQKEYLEDILNSGRHLLQLINDVLDLAKVEAGKIELFPESFSLRKAVGEVCSVAGPIAQKKQLQVVVSIDPELSGVTLDQMRFKQVVYNLLSNALKFTDSGGRVEIRCGPKGPHQFELAVKDTGIGIKPEDLPRLFKEFDQIESGAARRYEGTGLGLALTRKIVEMQAGSISVASEAGQGSTFTVILPRSCRKGQT
jgi:PAS domain S-box-containing protein